MFTVLGIFIALIVGFFVWRTAGILYFRRFVAWETASRRGLNYYGKPLAEREKFKKKLKQNAFFLFPVVSFEAKLQQSGKAKPFIPSITYEGVTGPSYSCTAESFREAAKYHPTAEDIFVSTQMKCGTTWMQQVVYEILSRGNRDLSDKGHVHMYAARRWIRFQ